ncbi:MULTISPECIES: restriction endonuclease subunit S [unclassified Shewanella]|uniref:restriction endonuclease subunit S n=1 Tax=unclassified Shewanella TaxID=196818 RepID=UPI00354C0629
MSELPKGWCVLPLNIAATLIRGVSYKKNESSSEFSEGSLPILRANNIQDGKLYFDDLVYIPADKIKAEQKIKAKDIVIAMSSGSKKLVGKSGVATVDFDGGFGTFCGLLRPNKHLDSRYIGHFTRSKYYADLVSSLSKGVNINNLKPAHFSEIMVPLAPLNEQIRIADKLDSILAKVDQAQARLEKIPHILKRFRQSVLAAATSGELTREWREENGLSYEWQSIKVSTLVSKIEAGKNIKCDERPPHDNEFGIIKISAVTWGFYDEAQSKTLKDDKLFIENRRVGVGDFLISRANTLELLGMPVIVKKVTKNLMLSDKVLRLVMPEQEKAWLDIFLRSPKGRLEIQSRATGNQESMRNIGQKALFDIDVLLPTSIEKTEIVKIVGLLTSHVEMLEKQYFIIKSRLDKLAQSILAKAFRGELVEQDSNDEPASLLLERIKLEQLEKPKPAKRTRNTKDKAAQKVEEASSTEASEESIQLQSEVLSMLQKANVELSAQQLMDKLTEQSFDAVDVLFTELKRLLDAAVITKAGSGENCTFKVIKK